MGKKKIIISLLVIILLIIIIGLIIFKINNTNETDSSSKKEYLKIGEEYKLKKGKSIYLKDEEDSSIKFISYADSRCKEGTECIWEGEIEYTLEFKNNNTKEKFNLGTVRTKEHTIDKYIIYLIDGDTKSLTIKVEENE